MARLIFDLSSVSLLFSLRRKKTKVLKSWHFYLWSADTFRHSQKGAPQPSQAMWVYREHGDERSLDKQATCFGFHSKLIAEALSFLPLNSCCMNRKELIMLCLFIWMPQSISFALIKLWKLLPSKGIVRIENKLDTGAPEFVPGFSSH